MFKKQIVYGVAHATYYAEQAEAGQHIAAMVVSPQQSQVVASPATCEIKHPALPLRKLIMNELSSF